MRRCSMREGRAMLISLVATLQAGSAASGTASPPTPLNESVVASPQNYPSSLDDFGVVSLLLDVDTAGKVSSCTVTESSGHKLMDKGTCSLFKARARFAPARNPDGAAVSGQYRLAVTWISGNNGISIHDDLPLSVARLPPDYHNPTKARVLFDGAGRVIGCEVETSSGSAKADEAACAYVRRQMTISPPKSGSADVPAVAIRYVTATMVAPDAQQR